ncbi:hypothetical protein HYW83_02075 [Candidatus Peregrinibacteria bacterium]|nr:hypothetical protein [Candidatus Peregrinibacteria bacterium]
MPEAAQRLEELVRDQFASELELSRESGLYSLKKSSNDVSPPADAQAASRLLITRLTTEQIVAILKKAQQPQLQMEPVTSFDRYIAALDVNKRMPRQIDTYVNSDRRAAWARQDANAGIGDSVSGWNLGIIDSVEKLEVDPNLTGTLGQKRSKNDAEWNRSGLRSPHPRRYALAQLRAILQRGKPLDAIGWSALNDDTGNSSVVPGGYWAGDRVYFFENSPDDRSDDVCFRPEVVVKAA